MEIFNHNILVLFHHYSHPSLFQYHYTCSQCCLPLEFTHNHLKHFHYRSSYAAVRQSHQGPQSSLEPGSVESSPSVPPNSQQLAEVTGQLERLHGTLLRNFLFGVNMNALSLYYTVHAGSGSLPVAPTISKEQVVVTIEALKKKFNSLKKATRECLEKHKIPVKDVAEVLVSLSPDDDECHRMFLKSHIKEFATAVDNFELFLTMDFHWNYLDPSLLNHLVTELELVEVKPDVKMYQSELQQFRMKTPLNLFHQTQRRKKIKLSPEFKEIAAEFDWPKDVTLEVLEQFRQEYASHYKVHEFAMMMANVRPGSFIITWFIPESVAEKFKGRVPVQILGKYSVTTLTVAGVCVYCDKTEVMHHDYPSHMYT